MVVKKLFNKRNIYIAVGSIIIITLVLLWFWKFSATKVATFNYPDFNVEKFIRSNNNSSVKIKRLILYMALL